MGAFVIAFLFTQAIEVPIYSLLLDCSLLAAFGASALTHPVVWFVIVHPRWHCSYLACSIVAELFAWLVEAAYFGLVLRYRRALWASLVANIASVTIGLVSRAWFGAP
ncbi:MAG TPA: hypothetical protein VIV60_31480 [Polyangiaceae bacterium]